MITLDDIKIYLNSELEIDIKTKSNKRKYVYGRALFSKLALDYIKRESGKRIATETIAKYLDCGSHSSVLRYIKVNFKHIEKQEPFYCEIYEKFNDIILLKEATTNTEAKDMYNILLKKYIKLNAKLNNIARIKKRDFDDEFIESIVDIANSINDNKRELFLDRIKPLAKLTNSAKY